MKDTIEKLERELDIARLEYDSVFRNLPEGLDWFGFEKALEPASEKVQEIGRKLRMIKTPRYVKLPTYGDRMKLSHFIDCVKSGGFIDYDGSGNYVKNGKMSDISIYPSDVKNGAVREDFDEIIWFNR